MTAVVIRRTLTLREHEIVLILRSVVKTSGDIGSCLLSEFHWPESVSAVSGATRQNTVRRDDDPVPGRFRYSHLKEAARVCGGRGSYGL